MVCELTCIWMFEFEINYNYKAGNMYEHILYPAHPFVIMYKLYSNTHSQLKFLLSVFSIHYMIQPVWPPSGKYKILATLIATLVL